MGLFFGMVGFFFNTFLMFFALFVWIGAAQESSMVQMKSAFGGIPVSAAMMTAFEVVAPDDSIEEVTRLILSGAQQDFPVVEAEQVVGVVTRDGVMKALAHRNHTLVRDIMRPEVMTVDASDMLEGAFQKLRESGSPALPILRGGRLVGLLTAENVGEFLMIQTATKGRRKPIT
jgi:CBS domain-containing protein